MAFCWVKVLAVLLILCSAGPLHAQIWEEQEQTFKAIFIYHFSQYVKWPEGDTAGAFSIGLLGGTNLLAPLQKMAREKKTIGDRKLVIKQCDIEKIKGECQILFISGSMKAKLEEILAQVKGKPVLTIGDTEGFARRGVAINFTRVRDILKFEINQKSIERVGLKASSQLLKLGLLVENSE